MNKKERIKLYNKVLKKIIPTKKELIEEQKIFEEINQKIKKINGKHSHLEWCGSSARNTHLKNDRDLDLFIMFDKELTDKELEKEGLRIGKNVFRGYKWEKAYSQHPYIRGIIKGFDIEIVPGYIVKSGSEKKSSVDRTPFHNKYLLKRLSEKQKNDIRLLKQFFKGIDAYGADLKNCSLPGYGIELLILYYKNFENALKEISKWKKIKIIKFNKEEEFFENPLVIIDPVDPKRNVASALTEEQFNKIILASKLFLKNPSIKFFFKQKNKKWNKKKVEKMLNKKELIAIKTEFPKKDLPDLIWGQLRRMLKKISNDLEENDFIVLRKKVWSNEKDVWFIFELETLKLQKAKKIIGPKVIDEENVKKFLEKKRKILSGPRIEQERVILEIEREKINASEILKDFLKKCEKQEKKAMKIILKKSKIIFEKEILKEYKGEFAEFFTKYLEGKEIFQ
ncbi:MAG: CCA tRNA nucleotidyltransferase [Candidatus ainarchaeum sp.]|nr:CCA tRNA nucleotidyltransferase [Candidatus ainarchaeum sp.]